MTLSYGTTMGYVSDPFRTENRTPTLKGSLFQPMVKPWDAVATTLENQSWRVFETRRNTARWQWVRPPPMVSPWAT